MSVVFAADSDPGAVETHRHHFGGLCGDWDLSEPAVVEHVGQLLKRLKIDLLAGGPCQPFSKAGRSIIRDQVRHGLKDPCDQRRDLWLGEPCRTVAAAVVRKVDWGALPRAR